MTATYELVGPAHISERSVADDGSVKRRSFYPGRMQDGVWIDGWIDDNGRTDLPQGALDLIAKVPEGAVRAAREAAEAADAEGARRVAEAQRLASEEQARFDAAVDRAVDAKLSAKVAEVVAVEMTKMGVATKATG